MEQQVGGLDAWRWFAEGIYAVWLPLAAIVGAASSGVVWVLKLSSRVDILTADVRRVETKVDKTDEKLDRLIDKLL